MKKGTCGVCWGIFTLTKNKSLRSHGHTNSWWGGKRVSSFCKGTGLLPTEFSDDTYKVARDISRKRYLLCRDKYGEKDDYTNWYFDDVIKLSKEIKNWKPIEESNNENTN